MFEHPHHTRAVLIVFGVAVTATVVTAHLPNGAARLAGVRASHGRIMGSGSLGPNPAD
jgi:hypothetical protein